MPGGHKLILLMLLGGVVFMMALSISSSGFVGLIVGISILLVVLEFLGMFFVIIKGEIRYGA